jgi:uncharacterized membrane protein YheB (UPF0754 family)
LEYIVTPLIGAIIGYFTNWLAIKMLFRPHTEKRLFGIKLPFTPGLIPKERERLTRKISETVSKNVLTPEVLAKELSSIKLVLDGKGATVGAVLENMGVADPAGIAERALLSALGNERVRETLMSESLTDFIRKAVGGILPKTVTTAGKWMEENPWIDERLEELTRRIVHENMGSLIGIFVNHKKIYANIKEGLFAYLADEDNQKLLLEKLIEAVENLRASEFTEEESRERAGMTGRLSVIARQIGEYLCGLNVDQVMGYIENFVREWKVMDKIADYIAKNIRVKEMIEEKLNAFAVDEAEALLLGVVNRELNAITWLGGVLGFIIGLISLIPRLL